MKRVVLNSPSASLPVLVTLQFQSKSAPIHSCLTSQLRNVLIMAMYNVRPACLNLKVHVSSFQFSIVIFVFRFEH